MGWWNRLSAINISVHVNRIEFCSVPGDYIGVGPWDPYKFLFPACFVFAVSDAYLIAWILDVVRLRVSHIYHSPSYQRQFRLGAQIVSTFLDGCPLGQKSGSCYYFGRPRRLDLPGRSLLRGAHETRRERNRLIPDF